MPNYDEMVDYVTRKFEERGQSPDPAEVMRVSARIIGKQGTRVDANHMAGLSDAARRRLAPKSQNGANDQIGMGGALVDSAGLVAHSAASALNQGVSTVASIPAAGEQLIARGMGYSPEEQTQGLFSRAFYGLNDEGKSHGDYVQEQAPDAISGAVLQGAGQIANPLNYVPASAAANLTGRAAVTALTGANMANTFVQNVQQEAQEKGQLSVRDYAGAAAGAMVEGSISALPGGQTLAAATKRIHPHAALREIGTEVVGKGMGGEVAGEAAQAGVGEGRMVTAEEALSSGVGGLAGSAPRVLGMAPAIISGRNERISADAKTRQINMDQLLASGQEFTAINAAQANDTSVRQRMGVQDAQQQAVAATREAALHGPQMRADADIAQSQREGVGVPQEQLIRDKVLARNKYEDQLAQDRASTDETMGRLESNTDLGREQRRVADEGAQRQLDEESHANDNVAYEKQYEDEARTYAAKHNYDPESIVAEVRAARASERQTGDPAVNDILKPPTEQMEADTRGLAGRDDGLDASPIDEPPAVAHARTEVEKAQLVRENLRRQAENARASEVQNTVDLKRPAVAAPNERALAKAAVAAAHKANKIDRQTAKRLTLELQTRDITVQRTEQIRAANEHSVENLIPSHRTFGDDAEGTYPTLEEQTGREFDRHADTPVDTLSPNARAFVDAQSPKMRAALQESLDHLQQHPDPKGDLLNLQNVVQVLKNPVIKRGTGKAREGAALNPAAAVVGATKAVAKGVGKGATAIAEVTKKPKAFVGRQVTSLRDMFFDDAAGRLKNSQSPVVRDVGDKFNSALGHGRDSQTRMHDRIDRATQNASVMSRAEAKELRALNAPYKDPKTGRVTSKLHDLVTRKTINDPKDTPLMKRIKEAFTEANDVTQQEMHAQGVPIRTNAHAGVGVLRQHMTSEASSSLGNKDVPFRDALVKQIADTNVHLTGPKKGQNYTVDEVMADLVGTNLTHNASVRRDALENGRKYVLPHYVEVNGKMRQVLSLDPRQYVRNTAGSATRRVGMVKAFGPDVSAESIHKMVNSAEHYDQTATSRMLDAYNGVPHGDDALDSGAFSHGVRAAKAAFSSIKTTVAAAYGPGEVFSMIGQVPAHHGLIGALNAVKHPNRAVQEGGIEADITNKVDLRGRVSPALENFASGVRRASGNNAINRGTHILAYEGGRSWAMGMKDAGTASKSDIAYMEVNHIPSYVQDAFKDGHANQEDVVSLARAVAENYSGQKSNMAEQGRLSRNAMVKTWGPMFLRYGENRVRNFLRSWDTAATAWNKGDRVLAGRILGSRLTGYTISAAAATAISQVLRYGVESLGMAMEAGEMAPLIGNFFGGSWSDLIYRNTNEDNAVKIANSVVWPLAAASEAFEVAVGKKSVVDVVPLAARVRNLAEGRDVAGDKAYSLYWKAQKPRGGTSSNPDRAGARSDIRRMLMRKDYVGATKLVNEYTRQLSRTDRMTFLRNSKLLPDKVEEKRQLYKEIGPTAYNLIAGHDETINQLMGK